MTVIDAPPLVSEQQGPFTVTQLLGRATAILTAAGVPTPDVDAELLAGHVLGVARGQIQAYAITERPLSAADAVALLDLVERRATREPLQHLLGRAYFRTLELEVGPGVFVPRPETEFVSGLAVQALRSVAAAQPIAVDLGTGSGAIALSLATEVPHSFVYGVENSAAAFVWTTQNFRRIAPHNAKPVFIDLADALPDLDGQVSVVASNPPYIPLAAVPRDPEVRLYDPAHALYGGVDGLDIVRQVSTTARRLLSPGGSLIIEHGELQSAEIAALLRSDGWNAVSGHRDLTGRDRATTAVR